MLFKTPNVFTCPIKGCLKTFKRRGNWTAHLRKQHPDFSLTGPAAPPPVDPASPPLDDVEMLPLADLLDSDSDSEAGDDGDHDGSGLNEDDIDNALDDALRAMLGISLRSFSPNRLHLHDSDNSDDSESEYKDLPALVDFENPDDDDNDNDDSSESEYEDLPALVDFEDDDEDNDYEPDEGDSDSDSDSDDEDEDEDEDDDEDEDEDEDNGDDADGKDEDGNGHNDKHVNDHDVDDNEDNGSGKGKDKEQDTDSDNNIYCASEVIPLALEMALRGVVAKLLDVNGNPEHESNVGEEDNGGASSSRPASDTGTAANPSFRDQFPVTYKVHKLISARPCDESGVYLEDGETPAPTTPSTPVNDWSPYKDRLQFEVADFLYTQNQTSGAKIDRLMELWAAAVLPHGETPPFRNHDDLYNTIDQTQLGDVRWRSFEMYRDVREIVKNMLANPDFKTQIDYAPVQEFNEDGVRQFRNFMSGDWAWAQADIIAEDPSTHSAAFVPIILGSDKTTVSVATGQNEYYPLYVSIGNIHNTTHRAHRNGVAVAGFLAIPKTKRKYADSVEYRKFRRQLFHSSISRILQSLKAGMTTPEVVLCGDGHFRKVIYGLGPYIADYPEQALLASIVQGWYPVCLADKSNLNEKNKPLRSREGTETLVLEKDLGELWDDYGIVGDVIPFTNDFPRADIHEIMAPDILHQLIKGTFKDHLIMWVEALLFATHGKARALEILSDIDRRYVYCTGFIPAPQPDSPSTPSPSRERMPPVILDGSSPRSSSSRVSSWSSRSTVQDTAAASYMSVENQLERGRRLAQMHVYNMRYLACNHHWGPFLPFSDGRRAMDAAAGDNELLQPILALFRITQNSDLVHTHDDNDEGLEEDVERGWLGGEEEEQEQEERECVICQSIQSMRRIPRGPNISMRGRR
ncbi:transcription factor [Ganoderma sinense ZZ0214-1]|uniref:Transcription factor n=1 Tax=Ganoderma sinense ZZ0214-1 TaxID=1077348 RepID=A0A2G8S310_9APHY|nr:transcription factor [Ganoderma sinense ZZ0214-1]